MQNLTRKAIMDSFVKLLNERPLHRITVKNIVEDCGVNRNSFYYHFEDIYGLLKWILEQEAFEVVKQFDLLVNYRDAFDFAINYVEQNSFFLNCIYDSVGRDELKRLTCSKSRMSMTRQSCLTTSLS